MVAAATVVVTLEVAKEAAVVEASLAVEGSEGWKEAWKGVTTAAQLVAGRLVADARAVRREAVRGAREMANAEAEQAG